MKYRFTNKVLICCSYMYKNRQCITIQS